MSKELITVTERELQGWPGASMTLAPQGKHSKMVLQFKDQTRMVVIATTPSDCRAVPNHLAVVRRELRAMGAERHHPTPAKPKPERAFKPHIPAYQTPFKELDQTMTQQNAKPVKKIEAIFAAIADLRYAEMLEFSGLLSSAAVSTDLKRRDVHGWAKMLQSAIDGVAA
ncbi:hypothetical protein GTZ99_12275 [Novosphingobium sp. FSY-8]|uniref:Uncharacterized protein n=1 Tax=Novosphingobium ovatum TaxID=1908523 RepID=A0ABW9XFL4_9SPHN|nr:hypothetical protein [Novosphingobium ovatum]NBC37326.1 hypothetical protein [Novosphingobium ovatum]